MSAPRTAVHASGPRRRPSGARRRPTGARRRTTRRSTGRRRPAAPRRRGPARRRTLSGRARWWPALLVGLAVLAGLAWRADQSIPRPPAGSMCTVPSTSFVLTAEQMANAATIAEVGRSRGLPERAIVIAVATAQQESRLRNLDYGDRDSLGLFQQRPSKGWGTPAQVQDPVYAAGIFYDRLVEVPGWETGRLTEVAQAVQRSGFPEAYQQWEGMAQALTTALLSGGPACT